MIVVILFFIELITLFLLSKMLTRNLSRFFYNLTKSRNATVYLMAFLFFPGTVLHELAHLLMAGILLVPVHDIEFIPKVTEDGIKLGSVSIEKKDPFRRFFIGVAPFFFGTSILLGLLFYVAKEQLFQNYWFILIIGYLVFEIGNTMFSSKQDMDGAFELLAVVCFFVVLFYFVGVRLPAFSIEQIITPLVQEVFEKGCLFLLVPLGIDALFLGLFFASKKKHP